MSDYKPPFSPWSVNRPDNPQLSKGWGRAEPREILLPHPRCFWAFVAIVQSLSPISVFCDAYGLQPAKLLCPLGFSRQEYWEGSHFLLQGIFLTHGSNPCHLHWQAGSLQRSYQEQRTYKADLRKGHQCKALIWEYLKVVMNTLKPRTNSITMRVTHTPDEGFKVKRTFFFFLG